VARVVTGPHVTRSANGRDELPEPLSNSSMRRSFHIALGGLFGVLCVGSLSAQDASDSATYLSLIATPPGALTSTFDVAITDDTTRHVGFYGRYGIQSLDTHEYTHNFGVSVDFPVGPARIGATLGYHWPNCTDGLCEPHVMGGINYGQNIVSVLLGKDPSSASFNVGIEVQTGFAFPRDTAMVSGLASVPVALVHHGTGLQVVPYIAPGLGVGLIRSTITGTEAGLLLAFNGGVGLVRVGSFALDASVGRIFLKDGNWIAGLGASIQAH